MQEPQPPVDRQSWSSAQWQAQWQAGAGGRIDMGLARMHDVLAELQLLRPPAVITVGGTNGKGSTCAFIGEILRQAGYRVGIYLSPPLVSLNDSLRVDGAPADEAELCAALLAASQTRSGPDLTWFELCTVAAWVLFARHDLAAWVLEVGMGGRDDAVNALDPDCAVLTSIDVDHQAYLGPDRESIGFIKAHIMRSGKPAVVCDPVPPKSVVAHAEAIGADLWLVGRDFNHSGDRQQWAWSGRGRRYHGLSYPALRGANQLLNAAGAIAALIAIRDRLPVNAQAVRTGLALVELPGRFQIVPGQPALVLDVAHNPQAAAALALNLDAMGFFPRTHAVLGVMADKDIPGLLAKIAPLVDVWHCCDLPTPRAATAERLAEQVRAACGGREVAIHRHASPAEALRAAAAAADPADRIVVFGSFYTVGGVLREGLPRLSAAHVG